MRNSPRTVNIYFATDGDILSPPVLPTVTNVTNIAGGNIPQEKLK